MGYCPNCGSAVTNEMKFCMNCGNRLQPLAAQTTAQTLENSGNPVETMQENVPVIATEIYEEAAVEPVTEVTPSEPSVQVDFSEMQEDGSEQLTETFVSDISSENIASVDEESASAEAMTVEYSMPAEETVQIEVTPIEEPKAAEVAPVEETKPVEEAVQIEVTPIEDVKPIEEPKAAEVAPVEEAKPVEEAVQIEVTPIEDVKPIEEPKAAEVAPVEEVKPVEEAVQIEVTPIEDVKPIEEPKAAEVAPVEETKPVEEAVQIEVTPIEDVKPIEEPKAAEVAPAEEAKPVETVKPTEPVKPVEPVTFEAPKQAAAPVVPVAPVQIPQPSINSTAVNTTTETQAQATPEQTAEEILRKYDFKPKKKSKYATMSTWGYIGSFLLMMVPVIGWIFMLVWAFGGCRKNNKKYLARAVLILTIVFSLIAGGVGYLYRDEIKDAVSKITDTFVQEDPESALSKFFTQVDGILSGNEDNSDNADNGKEHIIFTGDISNDFKSDLGSIEKDLDSGNVDKASKALFGFFDSWIGYAFDQSDETIDTSGLENDLDQAADIFLGLLGGDLGVLEDYGYDESAIQEITDAVQQKIIDKNYDYSGSDEINSAIDSLIDIINPDT